MVSNKKSKSLCIFNGLASSLPLMRRHGVRSIADQDRSSSNVCGQGVLHAKLPELNIFCCAVAITYMLAHNVSLIKGKRGQYRKYFSTQSGKSVNNEIISSLSPGADHESDDAGVLSILSGASTAKLRIS